MIDTITIVVTTWAPKGPIGDSRGESARKAIASWEQHLRYDSLLRLHIADDGSDHELYHNAYEFLPWASPPWDVTFSRQERGGVGASLNAGFAEAFARSPLALYAVDDWELTEEFDLNPWAQLLLEEQDIGAVRLGPPHPGLSGMVRLTYWGWVLMLDRHHFACSHRPALYHKRFLNAYGPFDEGCSALECERRYNERFCENLEGPAVALALPHPWKHVGEVEVGDVEPT